MTFMATVLRKYFFRFFGTDIARTIITLQGGPKPKKAEYVLLAPNQLKALQSMQKYAPTNQVRELFELYEKINNDYPINPQTAVRIARKDIFPTESQKEWHR